MNIKEYISSGIIESYVLGLASSEEREEFERMCAAHTEVRLAREEFEIQLENHALKNSVQPPAHVRSKLFAEIEIEQQKIGPRISTNSTQAPVVPIQPWWRYLAAASIVLLLTSTTLNFYFFSQFKSTERLYKDVLAQNQEYADNLKRTQVKFNEYEEAFRKMNDPAMVMVRMQGTFVATSPDSTSMATVFWDSNSKDVYLQINKMPVPSSDLQYQLWAIVDGVPVDAGVFDTNNGKPLVSMKNIPRAQAFAVTLEKKGGSPTPKGQMYVLGKVS